MTFLLFLFGCALAVGLFFIAADILKLPRLSTEKALLSAGKAEHKRMKSLDALFLGWAIKLSKHIRMDEYKRAHMARILNAASMDMTPEVYTAYTIVKPCALLLLTIPCLLIFPLLALPLVDISEDTAAFDYVTGLGYRQVPVVVAGENHWAGFRPDLIGGLG